MGLLENLEKVVEKKVQAKMGPVVKKMDEIVDILEDIRDSLKRIKR